MQIASSIGPIKQSFFSPLLCTESTEKYFVKSTTYFVISLVNTLVSRNFCQNRVRVNFCNFHTVWKLWEFSLKHLWQQFRKSNGFTKYVSY